MKETLDVATDPWGVTVERVELKDVRVPEQLMRAMAAEAEAARNARAKVIAAEGEHKASRALRHAAEVIMENPAALQVGRTIISLTVSHLSSLVEIFTNPDQHLSREQQYNSVSRPSRHSLQLYVLNIKSGNKNCNTATTRKVKLEMKHFKSSKIRL